MLITFQHTVSGILKTIIKLKKAAGTRIEIKLYKLYKEVLTEKCTGKKHSKQLNLL
jgi:hypothetical protein